MSAEIPLPVVHLIRRPNPDHPITKAEVQATIVKRIIPEGFIQDFPYGGLVEKRPFPHSWHSKHHQQYIQSITE